MVAHSTPSGEGRAPRILVVEDDPDVRRLLARVVAASGYRVDTAADGLEALRRIQRERPDLLLTDLIMPGLDGWRLIAQVQALDLGIPIIVVTALDDAAPAGVAVLRKPWDVAQLRAAIAERLPPGAVPPPLIASDHEAAV
jgi:two-component system response regulator MprA